MVISEAAKATLKRAKVMIKDAPCKCGVCVANLYLQLRREENLEAEQGKRA